MSQQTVLDIGFTIGIILMMMMAYVLSRVIK